MADKNKSFIRKIYLIAFKNRINQSVDAILTSSALAVVELVSTLSLMPFVYLVSQQETDQALLIYLNKLYLFWGNDYIDFLSFVALCSLSVLLTTILLRTAFQYRLNIYIEGTRSYISSNIFNNYIYKDYSSFDDIKTHDITKVVLSEVDLFVQQVFRPVINMFSYAIFSLIILVFFVLKDPLLSIVSLIFFTLSYAVIHRIIKKPLSKWSEKQDLSNKKRFDIVTNTMLGIKSIKFYALEKGIAKDFKEEADIFSDSWARLVFLSHLSGYILEGLIFACIIFSTIFLVGNEKGSLLLFLPQLVFLLIVAYKLRPAMQHIYLGVVGLRYGQVSIDNLLERYPSNKMASECQLKKDVCLVGDSNSIHIRNLSFSYSLNSQTIIDNFSANLPSGSVLAVIGSSGSGKSTLIDLLLGLRVPSKGEVYFGDVKQGGSQDAWKKIIGYVPQQVFILDKTLKENVLFGSDNEIEDDYYKQILEISCLTVLNASLRHDAPLGEGGSKISGGQKQRIGIARALVNNPKYLIFDEATSGLDTYTENLVITRILQNSPHTTIILVTHNIENLKYVTHILNFDDPSLEIKETIKTNLIS